MAVKSDPYKTLATTRIERDRAEGQAYDLFLAASVYQGFARLGCTCDQTALARNCPACNLEQALRTYQRLPESS